MMAMIQVPPSEAPILAWLEEHESFTPHWGQMQILDALAAGKREIDVRAGKRSGKSILVKMLAKYYLLEQQRRIWIMGPTWDIVDRMYRPLWNEIQKSARADEIMILDRQRQSRRMATSGGGLLEGVSWAAPEQIEGEGLHVVITDESQHLTEDVYNRISARLVGDWVWLRIGSPATDGASFYEQNAYALGIAKMPRYAGPFTWPSWANPSPDVRAAVRIELENLKAIRKSLGKDHPLYRQRRMRFLVTYGGVQVPPADVAIGTFDPTIHVRECAYDPELPVFLAIDPGWYPSYYAVAVLQPHPRGTMLGTEPPDRDDDIELWQIDEFYAQHMLTGQVLDVLKEREWWGRVTRAVIDVAARRTSSQTGFSELAVWQSRTNFPVDTQFVPIDEGLDTHRRWLEQNRLFHDRFRCPDTIREYALYRMRARTPSDAKDTPIDAHNHAMKALAYFLVGSYGVGYAAPGPIIWERALSAPARRSFR
jgi:hypothetical protein